MAESRCTSGLRLRFTWIVLDVKSAYSLGSDALTNATKATFCGVAVVQ